MTTELPTRDAGRRRPARLRIALLSLLALLAGALAGCGDPDDDDDGGGGGYVSASWIGQERAYYGQ